MRTFNMNPLYRTDSYKPSHFIFLPPDLQRMDSYIESRGGHFGLVMYFGPQMLLKEYLTERVTADHVKEAAERWAKHGVPFDREGWEHVVRRHDGRIPVRIRSIPEGSVLSTGNLLAKFESTDERVPWMGGWMETQIVRGTWFPSTVGTLSWHTVRCIYQHLVETGNDPDGEIPFKLHDFGGRGVSSSESAGIGGCAHLVNSMGSDTFEGVEYARQFYGEDMAGFSIPATEHSTIISWGEAGELACYRNVVKQAAARGHKYVACVSDSYDIFRAVGWWTDPEYLLNDVKAAGLTLVIRPDSGDPVETNLEILRIIERKIGMHTNTKGYKVIPTFPGGSSIRIIQGDGNDDLDSVDRLYRALKAERYSASNLTIGMGGGLLQRVHRDLQRWALKPSEAIIAGRAVPLQKKPVGDPGKWSKAGHLDIVRRDGRWQTVIGEQWDSELVTVFQDGELKKEWSFKEVRARARAAMLESLRG